MAEMKFVGIGDYWIPGEFIKSGFADLVKAGHTLETIEWDAGGVEGMVNINLLIETKGSEAYEVPQDVLDAVKNADVILTQFCPINKKVMEHCPNLKAVGVFRAGIENINLEVANEKGIVILNTPGRNANAVADFTVGMLLSECRNIARSHKELKDGKWIRDYANKGVIPDLCDKTVGLVGLGIIGGKVAKRLQAFDAKIIAYDPYAKDAPDGVEMVSLEELMKRSDFVSVHARLTEESKHVVNADMLALMKPTAYIINTARSGLIDEKAMYNALKDHKIMGAALDVFDEEPIDNTYPLVTLENVTVTPHLAGTTKDAFTGSPKLLAAQFEKYLNKEDSRNIVNKETYDKQRKS